MATRKKAPKPLLVAEEDEKPSVSIRPDRQVTEAWIVVQGFKSLAARHSFAIRPLTLLAGANSSGKSSLMQPLLLLKQTLDSPHDPGTLKLYGPHVYFSRAEEVLSQVGSENGASTFSVLLEDESTTFVDSEGIEHSYELSPPDRVELTFRRSGESSFSLKRARRRHQNVPINLEEGMTGQRLANALGFADVNIHDEVRDPETIPRLYLDTERCYFLVREHEDAALAPESRTSSRASGEDYFSDFLTSYLSTIIHVPGIRQYPAGASPPAAVDGPFPGPFDAYTASLIHDWQERDPEKLSRLVRMLQELGMTSGIEARQPDARQVELWVQRGLAEGEAQARSWVRLNHVGLGVSQLLPVLVALLVSTRNNWVYLEQPELHLHPRAQVRLANFLAEAANSGRRLIVETHSALLLRSLQTLIAKGELAPEKVMLHWFERDEQGLSKVTSREPDADGSYGDWPEDFGDVDMETDASYLDAVEKKMGLG